MPGGGGHWLDAIVWLRLLLRLLLWGRGLHAKWTRHVHARLLRLLLLGWRVLKGRGVLCARRELLLLLLLRGGHGSVV